MDSQQSSRRRFLRTSGAALGLSFAGVQLSSLLPLAEAATAARDQQSALKNLSSEEAADVEAITALIIPSDDTPGAREAGVIYFIDAVLGDQFAHMREPLQAQIRDINALAGEGAPRFAALDAARQVQVMQQADEADALGLLVSLTLFGMFAMPTYGGNRNHVGWDLIGFDHRHAWLPPFGHYDAELASDAGEAKDS